MCKYFEVVNGSVDALSVCVLGVFDVFGTVYG